MENFKKKVRKRRANDKNEGIRRAQKICPVCP
jgi:hypothetical protein